MNKPTWKDFVWAVVILVVVILVSVVVVTKQPITPPTSNTVNIDSLLETNDSIKVMIQVKDSIKNEEIQKVLKLDNDSTLELFKQLVRE